MPRDGEEKMRHAIEQWLIAREASLNNSSQDALSIYADADLRLLAVFAADWKLEDPTLLSSAYHAFRRALVAENKHLGPRALLTVLTHGRG